MKQNIQYYIDAYNNLHNALTEVTEKVTSIIEFIANHQFSTDKFTYEYSINPEFTKYTKFNHDKEYIMRQLLQSERDNDVCFNVIGIFTVNKKQVHFSEIEPFYINGRKYSINTIPVRWIGSDTDYLSGEEDTYDFKSEYLMGYSEREKIREMEDAKTLLEQIAEQSRVLQRAEESKLKTKIPSALCGRTKNLMKEFKNRFDGDDEIIISVLTERVINKIAKQDELKRLDALQMKYLSELPHT
jgi:hypothetical protein